MEDFSKYFKSMLDQLMKSGMSGGEMNFDIKGFDMNNAPPFMQMFFGMSPEKKEKLAVRKLSDEELQQYKELNEGRDKIQSQFRRLVNQQKKLEADYELFWQDIKDNSNLKADERSLYIDEETGFLFREVDVNKTEDEE